MSVTVHQSAQYDRQRWRNGGGWTQEVARSLPGAAGVDWTWRVSIAEIETDGPFSQFPNVERLLVLLDGTGMQLTVDGQSHELIEQYVHMRFSGEAHIECSLIDGPTRDLNVMWRRGGYTDEPHHEPRDAQVFQRLIGGTFSITAQPAELWVMHILAGTSVAGPGLAAGAEPTDTIVIDATTSEVPIRQSFLGTGTILLVRVCLGVRAVGQTSGRL